MNAPTRRRRSFGFWFFAAVAITLGVASSWCLIPATPKPAAVAGPSSLAAALPLASGPLRRSPENPRYFSTPDGHPVYLTGSHTWNNLQDAGFDDPPKPFDYAGYLSFLELHHLNFVRLWRWEVTRWTEPSAHRVVYCPLQPWRRTGPGAALDGKPKFDFEKFNDAYFQRLRERVAAAGAHGVYVSIMLFEGWVVRFAPDDWAFHPFNAANNINGIDGDPDGDRKAIELFTDPSPAVLRVQRAYVRRVVETVNNLDNVLYEISNENAPGSFATWQEGMVGFIRSCEADLPKQHPIGVTSAGHGNKGDFARLLATSADWISPNPDDADYKTNPPAAGGAKVFIVDTDHLWGLGGDVQWVWKSFTRGLNPIFMDPYDRSFIAGPDPLAQWEPVRRALGQTASFAERLDLARAKPQPALASTGFCLANPGREYLVYLPFDPHWLESKRYLRSARQPISTFRSRFSRRATLDLSAAAGRFSVEWFNPASGETTSGPSVAGGRHVSFTAPFKGAAVLFLRQAPAAAGNG